MTMTSPFHTPSFGDEDFNLPSLPGISSPEGPITTNLCYSPLQSSPSQNSSPNLLPQPATSQGQGHHQGQAPQGQIQNHQIHAQTFQGFQQNGFQNYHINTDSVLPKFPPQNFDIPDIQVMNCFDGNYVNTNLVTTAQAMATSQARFVNTRQQVQNAGIAHTRTVQMGLFQQNSPTGTVSSRTSPGRESSAEESSSDDGVPLAQLAQKRSAPEPQPPKPTPQSAAKKPRTPKKRKKKDPNEPQKPVSAYALFFRDTQAAIKTRNPSASFGEVSKIVASMWDGLDEENKGEYKKRTELAKKEYLKQLAAYRATLVSNGALDSNEVVQQQPTKNSNKQQKQQTQQHRTSPLQQPILPNPAMTTVPMTTHQMTTSISMPPMPGMPLSHMPNNNHMGVPLNQGHMMSPPGYRMMHQGHMGPPQIPPHLASHIPGHNGLSPNSMLSTQAEPIGMHDGYMGNQVMINCGPLNVENPANSMCIRTGCGNPAMHSQHCNNEFCSNDCVVSHCRDVFTQWVASRQETSPYASVK